ncbi:MAG: GNAT family N-acetyltransferase [Conexibacteraceae bacterium]|nr:GNAT family N-acetyltransferase [Conexibacteraceae bacterium]
MNFGPRVLREARFDEGDEQFLWLMLVEAASWPPGEERLSADEAHSDPSLAVYVAGWGRDGDRGIVAESGGRRTGAAWWRFFTAEDHGYGFIEPSVPELAIAVAAPWRGRGVGTALLDGLIDRAAETGLPALSLSVEFDNPALRLYERLGFERVERVGGAWTMRRDVRRGAQ